MSAQFSIAYLIGDNENGAEGQAKRGKRKRKPRRQTPSTGKIGKYL
jgi:hypothetical protein